MHAHFSPSLLSLFSLFLTILNDRNNMSLITILNALIKRFKPRSYIRMRVEFPAMLPFDFSPDGYFDKDLLRMSSDEIESKAFAIHTALVNNCNIAPKRLRGTIVPILDTSSLYNHKIVIKCEVPEDAPIELIRDVLIRKFNGNCTLFI